MTHKHHTTTKKIIKGFVALYLRISEDKNGREEGVGVQERLGRKYANQVWPGLPVRVYSDNNKSAAKSDVDRPAFDQLCKDISAGQVGHLWTVEQSRLARTEIGWFEFAALADAAGLELAHTKRDGIVSMSSEVAGIKAVLNANEIKKLRQRVKDRLHDNALRGQPKGGKHYGYEAARLSDGTPTLAIVEDQAEVIREVARRVLDGETQLSIVTDLDKRGIRGAKGGTIGRLSTFMTSPTLAGIVEVDGQEVTGNWTPILSVETWRAVRDKIKVQPRGANRKYLLSSILRCDVCKGGVTVTQWKVNDKLIRFAKCRPRLGGHSCVGIMYDKVETYVMAELWRHLDNPEFRAALAADGHEAERGAITHRLDAVEAKRRKLARRWALADMDDDEHAEAKAALDEREAELRGQLEALAPTTITGDEIDEARQAWDYMTLAEQRAFVQTFIREIPVRRSGRGRWTPVGERLDIVWRPVGVASAAQGRDGDSGAAQECDAVLDRDDAAA